MLNAGAAHWQTPPTGTESGIALQMVCDGMNKRVHACLAVWTKMQHGTAYDQEWAHNR